MDVDNFMFPNYEGEKLSKTSEFIIKAIYKYDINFQ